MVYILTECGFPSACFQPWYSRCVTSNPECSRCCLTVNCWLSRTSTNSRLFLKSQFVRCRAEMRYH